jgi:hypothetical protein
VPEKRSGCSHQSSRGHSRTIGSSPGMTPTAKERRLPHCRTAPRLPARASCLDA